MRRLPRSDALKELIPTLCAALLLTSFATAELDWPQFRGPSGQGQAHSTGLPTQWSEEQNIHWKVAIPGQGWSSPVIADDQVWLTTATDEGRSLRALCLSRVSGQILHNVEVFVRDDVEHVHKQNSHATPTPVIDHEHVYVHFGANGTAALTRDGEIVWKNQKLQYKTPHGSANSPVLHGGRLIVCCDGSDRQFLTALNKRTGEIAWRHDRAHMEAARQKSQAEQNPDRAGLPFIAFSTPLIIEVDSVAMIISTPADHVVANRVDTGEEVWWYPYNCFSLVARPVHGNGLVYAIGGLRDGHYVMYAIPEDSKGELSESDLAWKHEKSVPQCPSPLLIKKKILLMKDSGVATCLDAISGDELWQERIGEGFKASPIAIGDNAYLLSQKGKITVAKIGDSFERLATNELDGLFLASPAVAGDALYLRSESHLYCVKNQ